MKPRTKTYPCPGCKKDVEAQVPTKALVGRKGYWDSAVRCPHCTNLHFKKIWPGGHVEITDLSRKE